MEKDTGGENIGNNLDVLEQPFSSLFFSFSKSTQSKFSNIALGIICEIEG